MGKIRAFLTLLIILLVVFCGIVFTLNNALVVQSNLIFWQTPEMPLGVLMTITLLLGCSLGLLANALLSWRLIRQRNELQKQLDQSQKRFEQLQ
jgi:uncharacterized integral membrane protein